MPEIIQKALATITPGDDEADAPFGSFELILSAPTLDRDRETLAADEWKTPLPDHIVMDIDHGMSVATTAGSGVPRLGDDGLLRVKGTYASTEVGQTTRTLVNEGHIRTASVSFLTDKSVKDSKPQRELLNGAFVAVPSNREAVILSSKAFQAIEAEQKAAKDDGIAYADPGYLDAEGKPAKDGNGEPRYKIDTEAHVRAAWSYINMPKNAEFYTADQLQKVKDKIKAAAAKFGIEIAEDKKDDAKSVYNSVTDLLAAAVTVKAGARNSAADGKMVQAIHDAASLLGAQCVSESEPDVEDGASEGANKSVKSIFVVGKSMTGSVEDLRDRIQCALNDAAGGGDYGRWACILATYMNPDGMGGSVVYSLGGETLCRAFSDDGACVCLDSNIQAVTLVTSVAAIPDTVDGDPTPLPPAAAEAGKSFGASGLPAPTVKATPVPVLTPSDIEDFRAKLDALTKSSGDNPGSPESPADSPAEPSESPDSKAASKQDPADDESADDDDDAADDAADDEAEEKEDEHKRFRLMRTQMLAANARAAALAS